MSQHNRKYSIVFSIILASLAAAVALAGCTDDLIYETEEIPDAEVEIRGEVIYKPLVPMKVQTRAEDAPVGTKYTGIKSLYVFFFNSEGERLNEYCGEVNFTPAPSDGSTHEHVTFKKKVRTGRYYVYAVANICDNQKSDLGKVTSIELLRKFRLDWNDRIEDDLEMFGVFRQGYTENASAPDNEDFETDEPITVTPDRNSLHSWVRRAVSKVTVDFDGTNLKDGVTVYIKNAVLKHVASGAFLGTSSHIGDDGIELGTSDYSISYGSGESHSAWPRVTKTTPKFSPSEVWGVAGFHDDGAKALPCYENMQGTHKDKSKLQDSDGDGIIDSEKFDGVENGTYLEVEGYYAAERPEYKSSGKIIYRFMLGKDAVNNFDLVRNHHYKITMRFKGYGNDVDWHIEYSEKYLDATYPEDVNYQGKFFSPDPAYTTFPNAGHTFEDQNVITVSSFKTDGTTNVWIEPEITYTYYSHDDETDNWEVDNTTSGWLTTTEGPLSEDKSHKPYTFVASMTEPTTVTINNLFPKTEKGSENAPHNLSNETGGSAVENTANCYMVGAPGWYCFPLVYGNAISGKGDNTAAYSSPHMVNHLNKQIGAPYIKDNEGIDLSSNVSVKLIWQDAEDLVEPDKIAYDPALFGGKGGIKFKISTIQEGNAVIALIDNKAKEDDYVVHAREAPYEKLGNTKAVWSWHIWVTRFGFDFEKHIRILNHEEKAFDVMPVNLGWCSGNNPIRYYKRRKCEIRFRVGDSEITRTIVQYPHFAVPRGDHPYYQWGRKDPFVGTNTIWGNKARWTHDGTPYGTGGEYNPPRLYNEPEVFSNNKNRKHAKDCLDVLVKNPDKWLNAPREPKNPSDFTQGFYSTNESYPDLWSIGDEKTVYDPCPPGYRVGPGDLFTGFTIPGKHTDPTLPRYWYDVIESNMLSDYYDLETVNSEVLEFYTDPRKVQSVIFPVTGYRDYDGKAEVVKYPGGTEKPEGFAWTGKAKDATNSYHLKFRRNDPVTEGDWNNRIVSPEASIIAPSGDYYNCNGFAVRPVVSSSTK